MRRSHTLTKAEGNCSKQAVEVVQETGCLLYITVWIRKWSLWANVCVVTQWPQIQEEFQISNFDCYHWDGIQSKNKWSSLNGIRIRSNYSSKTARTPNQLEKKSISKQFIFKRKIKKVELDHVSENDLYITTFEY